MAGSCAGSGHCCTSDTAGKALSFGFYGWAYGQVYVQIRLALEESKGPSGKMVARRTPAGQCVVKRPFEQALLM